MRTEIRPPFYLIPVLLFSILFTACEEKPDFIGRELLPNADEFMVAFDSIELVHGFSVRYDSVAAGYKETHLIGSIQDPFFGYSSASLVTTISPTSNSRSFGPNPVVDSVYLIMEWQEIIGEGDQAITIKLHEFTELIHYDSTYFTNWDVSGKIKQPELGSVQILPGDSTAKIFITDQEFIDKFLTAEDSILDDANYLQEYIYGLYYTAEQATDAGKILKFDFNEGANWLRFYYHNDTSVELAQSYSVDNTTNGKINLYSHDVSGFPVESYLGNGSENDSLIFIQSMAGLVSVIRFPELQHWIDSMPVAINEARLILPIADTGMTMQQSKYFCESLNMYFINRDGSLSRTYDYYLDAASLGGQLDEDDGVYTFTVKVQMQSILAEQVENLDLMLFASSTGETVKRSVLYGWNAKDSKKRPRLEITYTKL